MSKLYYVGPKVEISNHGIFYRKSKEDKYTYLVVALEIFKSIDNDYEKKPLYSHSFKNKKLKEEDMSKVLKHCEKDFEKCITQEKEKYKQKIQHEIEYIQTLPSLTGIDKEVWFKNIEIMEAYTIQRAINKMYYMHCIYTIAEVIKHKKIKEITAPLSKNFFHVLNTLKGTLITGKPSLDAELIGTYTEEDNGMILKLMIRNI